MTIFAKQALLPEGWRENVRLTLAQGRIAQVAIDAAADADDKRVDTLLPALANLHSHTFQRAMAGMTEKRGASADSFWTWRELMYRFLQHLSPDDVEAIASFAFMEMQEAGFGSVAEFHYLHNAIGGAAFTNKAELSGRIMASASQTGIGLTLLPVLYSYAGLGNKPLAERQLRFKNTREEFSQLHAEANRLMENSLPADARMGVAPHSLRAVNAEDLLAIAKRFNAGPIHLHIAEQTAEVDEVSAATGQRPVEWLLSHAEVNRNWCLIHATQMTRAETIELAKTGAVAGLCPITEANLGDGIFNATDYLNAGGPFGVGTDSNINISVSGELCTLEYSQRLRDRQRNVLAQENGATGHNLYTRAAAGGAQALGRACGAIAVGNWADLVAIDSEHIQLYALTKDQLLDGWIFASNTKVVTDLWSAGRHSVREGQHIQRDAIESKYRAVLKRLSQMP
jgi:formiminoglutamate deiminase